MITRKNVTQYGMLIMMFGLLAMIAPNITGLSIAFAVGLLVFIVGIFRIILAFQVAQFSHQLLLLLIGLLTSVCGLLMIANLMITADLLTLLLAAYFIAEGILEISISVYLRPKMGAAWLILSGLISILLGVLIAAQFPLSGAWAIGILFGIKLFFVGLMMVTINKNILK
ncbi:MAG: DUF308 domain-containing protein [Gammaproteobacteria bacterium]|nr:DUF308 domain-containing protein [Gammaproteobacteria bacterium]